MQAEVARAPCVSAFRLACLQQVGEHGGVQAPGGLPAPGMQHLAALHHLLSSAPRPPRGPFSSQGPGPHSAGGGCFWGGRVTGRGVVSVETEASIRAGGCYMGCEGLELTGLCLLVITFFRKHVYTCGEARVIPSILGPLLCRWTLRGGATPRLCPRGASGSTEGCDRGPQLPFFCLLSTHPASWPAAVQNASWPAHR